MDCIDPKKELFRWGPIDGVPLYPDFWFLGFVEFKKSYPPGWPEVLMFSYGEKFVAVLDREKLYKHGEAVFEKYLLDNDQFNENWQKWEKLTVKIEKFFDSIDKHGISAKNISELFTEWKELAGREFWNIGCVPEVGNWGGEQLLAKELKKRIQKTEDFNFAYERLTAPEDFSFYQKEELALMRLKKYAGDALETKLKKHQKSFFWLLNSFHSTRVLPVSYFRNRLNKETIQSANAKIKEIYEHKKQAISSKKEVISKYDLPQEIYEMSRRLAFSIWWQDARKAYIFQCNHMTDIFLKKISKMNGLDFFDLHYYMVNEVENLLENKIIISDEEINRRKGSFLQVWDGQNASIFSGKDADAKMKPYQPKKVKGSIKSFKGMVVNRGYVKGRVRILLSPSEADKMKKGDILVAPMTSPEYIIALRKSAAIITDEGGMTCHAAIVSRELKIPGIVATKIATKVLKDGDLVEVDANQGVVKILNREG